MNMENLDRFRATLKEQGILAALLSNPATLTWLSGYAPPIQTGPNPFEGGPALGWWVDDQLTLLLSDGESAAAAALGAQVRDYVAFTIDSLRGMQHQGAVLHTLLAASAPLIGKIGVELNFLPASLATQLHQVFPQAQFHPLDGAFEGLRAVKSAQEIAKIRAALRLCDLAQAYVAAHAQPGISEIELWAGLKGQLEIAAGTRVPVLADLIAGPRTAEVGGLPGTTILQPGDAVIADIVPRLEGYWGDNAATHFVGEPGEELKKIYRIVRQALRKGVEAVHPGLRAGELDRMLREEIENSGYPVYPHHSGHGLGTTYHEEPRLVPGNQIELAQGMVVALEPGIYVPGIGGVRLEDVVLVTDHGCELLTTHLLKDVLF
jgi:Xaa-Pro dipeptidase